jgi:phage shock protein E
MKKYLLFAFLALAACTTLTKIDVSVYEEVKGLSSLVNDQQREYVLIDVRTFEEFETGFIPTAQNIPHGEIVGGVESMDLKKDDLIVLYCRSGARAGRALEALTDAGYINVANFGGVSSWPGELDFPAE